MKYELIIFDMDGTILNTLDDMKDAVNFALKKNGLPERTLDEIKWFVGQGMQVLIHRAVPDGTSAETETKVREDFLPYYSEHAADKTAPYDGITEAAEQIKSLGYKIVVNSNKPDKEAGILAEQYFPGVFDFVLGARDDLQKKPSPDGVNFLAEKFVVEKSKVVYIGDSDIDFLTAKNAGVTFIGCDWGFRGKEFLVKQGAEHIAMKPADLVAILTENKF